MERKNWDRVEEIFGEVVGRPPEEHQHHLERLCGEDTELRQQVERLLHADGAALDFLDEVVPIPSFPTLAPPPVAGERLGPYRILRQIGEGGMGTVFLAERDDGAFHRQVAIKILRRGTENDSTVKRLERERQILAGLDHPNIARLLDGGTTTAGLPYVVMEFIDGEPIDQACQRMRLTPAARVDLMLTVCDAVTAAHRKLVVHRDLKPSNILIDSSGHPKLLDFGIAKLLEANELGTQLEPTESWDRRLTPAYASPEQMRGERITVATDVYLLGVVLYKLLAGTLPYRFENRSMAEVERMVTTQSPPSLSQVAPGLDTDLDAIVLKALRGAPEDRYGSVDELAEDLRRYRGGLPVLARQGNLRYLTSKFLRRHWLPVSTALLFTLLITAFAISTAAQALKIERTLDRLVAMEGFLVELFNAASPQAAKSRQILVQEVLERGERQLDGGTLEEFGSKGLLHALFGRISLHLGEHRKAQNHLEKALSSYAEIEADPFLEVAVLRAQGDLALTRLYLAEAEEEAEKAEELAHDALQKGRTLLSQESVELLGLLNNLTTIYCLQGKWDEAAPLVDEAYSMLQGREDTLSVHHAVALHSKALLLKNQVGKTKDAQELYAKALKIYRHLEGDVHPDVAGLLNQLGVLARDEGDLESAVEHFRKALEVRQALYPQGHWETGQSLFQLAMIQWQRGELQPAEDFMSQAWRIYEQDPDRGRTYGRTIFLWLHLAELRLRQGRIQEAQEMIEELSPEWWAARKPSSENLALARRALGCTLLAQGRLDEAEALLTQSLPALENRYGEQAWETELARECLGRLPDKR